MRGSKQHFSSLRRCRVYFLVIALLMTTTLLFLTYGWNFSLKLSRLSNRYKSLIPSTRIVAITGHNRNTTTVPFTALMKRGAVNNSSPSYNESKFVDPSLEALLTLSHENKSVTLTSVKRFVNESTLSVLVGNKDNKNLDDQTGRLDGSGSAKNTVALVDTTKLQQVNQAHLKDNDKPHHSTKTLNDTDKVTLKPLLPESHESNVFKTDKTTVDYVTVTQSDASVDKPSKPHKDSIRKDVTNVIKTSMTNDSAKTDVTSHSARENKADNHRQTMSSENDNEMTKHNGATNLKTNRETVEHESVHINNTGTKPSIITTEPAKTEKMSLQDKLNEQLKNRYNSLRIKQTGKGTPRFETLSYKNNLMEQLKHGLWGMGALRRTQAVPRSPKSTVRPEMCTGCFKTDFKQLIDSPDLCKTDSDMHVLIMISSSPGKREARDAIRNTWGKVCYDKDSGVRCVFVFGEHQDSDINKALIEETKTHQDIIQYAFRDTYANLTFKTMVSLKWASENCQKAKYVMKTDDDMYVNTELLPLMVQGAPDTDFLGGYCWGPSSPHRDTNSKWYVSFEQFAQSSYPKMCSGTGYVMSHDVAVKVLGQSVDIPFFYLEDVYVSLCLKKLGIQPILLNGFSNIPIEFDSCSYRNQVITSHELPPGELKRIWPEILKCPKANLSPTIVYSPRIY